MSRDLGTYHVRVEYYGGDGYIMEYGTGARYIGGGRGSCVPLTAVRIPPTWESEQNLIECIRFQFGENNYSCDCNRKLFLDHAHQREPGDYPCGETVRIKKLSIIDPEGDIVWEEDPFEDE